MPNAAPPLHRAARDRAADVTSPSVSRTGASLAASAVAAQPSTSSPDGALSGVPASWAGFGALLAGAGERAPADALRLAAVTTGTAGTADRVDLSGMWALPADPAAPRSHELIRALDDKGLMLPITVTEATRVPTDRDGIGTSAGGGQSIRSARETMIPSGPRTEAMRHASSYSPTPPTRP